MNSQTLTGHPRDPTIRDGFISGSGQEVREEVTNFSFLSGILRDSKMLMFCPTCANILVIEEGQKCYRFACNTCPYIYNVTTKVRIPLQIKVMLEREL